MAWPVEMSAATSTAVLLDRHTDTSSTLFGVPATKSYTLRRSPLNQRFSPANHRFSMTNACTGRSYGTCPVLSDRSSHIAKRRTHHVSRLVNCCIRQASRALCPPCSQPVHLPCLQRLLSKRGTVSPIEGIRPCEVIKPAAFPVIGACEIEKRSGVRLGSLGCGRRASVPT